MIYCIPTFKYVAPNTLREVLEALNDYRDSAKVLAGGTDLIPNLKRGRVRPRVLVDIKRVPELSYIRVDEEYLLIGAATKLSAILKSSEVKRITPALHDAVSSIGCPSIRNRATIGGNLCNASPVADTAPPLLAYKALVKVCSVNGERTIPLEEFLLGPGKTVLEANELMTEIKVHIAQGSSTFLKLGRRDGFTLSIVSVAAFARKHDRKIEDVTIAVGGVAPVPCRATAVEDFLRGKTISDHCVREAAALAENLVVPSAREGFHRASPAYRKRVTPVMVRRALEQILGE